MLEGAFDRPSGDAGAEATLLLDERRRILVESIRALPLVAAFFAIAAWKGHNGIERLGSAIIVAGALWIVYYLRSPWNRRRRTESRPDARRIPARPGVEIRPPDPLAAQRKVTESASCGRRAHR
jgi:hypothetical protein